VDCAHGNDAFRALTKEQRIARETQAIGLIRRHAGCGFSVTVDQKDFALVAPKVGFGAEAYEFCVYLGLIGVIEWLDGLTGSPSRVAYFFEGGHKHQSHANRLMQFIRQDERLRGLYRYSSHSFVDKRTSRPV
jgi:hypothetical protein